MREFIEGGSYDSSPAANLMAQRNGFRNSKEQAEDNVRRHKEFMAQPGWIQMPKGLKPETFNGRIDRPKPTPMPRPVGGSWDRPNRGFSQVPKRQTRPLNGTLRNAMQSVAAPTVNIDDTNRRLL